MDVISACIIELISRMTVKEAFDIACRIDMKRAHFAPPTVPVIFHHGFDGYIGARGMSMIITEWVTGIHPMYQGPSSNMLGRILKSYVEVDKRNGGYTYYRMSHWTDADISAFRSGALTQDHAINLNLCMDIVPDVSPNESTLSTILVHPEGGVMPLPEAMTNIGSVDDSTTNPRLVKPDISESIVEKTIDLEPSKPLGLLKVSREMMEERSSEGLTPNEGDSTPPAKLFKSKGLVKMSSGMRFIETLLHQLNVDYELEKTFNGCAYNRKLRFDIMIILKGRVGLIEYDGRQHFEMCRFTPSEDALIDQRMRDSIKTLYCKLTSKPLLRIAYNTPESDIEAMIITFINAIKCSNAPSYVYSDHALYSDLMKITS